MTAIAIEGLRVTLGGRAVVDGVSLDVPAGQWVGLIGPNGAGKTTLLRAIAGLVRHEGEVTLHGRDAGALGRRERAQALAVVPQDPLTPPWMTVAEYVLLGRTPYLGALARESGSDREIAARSLARLDLLGFGDRPLGTLSGERQRVVVARALAQEASIVLLDEPTAALDVGHQQQALELLDTLRGERELTLVAAMHDLTLASQYADRMVLLDAGHVVADGSPAEVLTENALARHYAANVRVVEVDGRLAVVPARPSR